MLLQLDGTVVVQILNFVVFLALLNIVFLRPVGRALAARRAHINKIAAELELAQREAKELRNAGDARRQTVRRECEELIMKARTEATNEADTITARSGALAQERISQAQITVAGEVAAATARENELVEELSGMLLDRAIGATR